MQAAPAELAVGTVGGRPQKTSFAAGTRVQSPGLGNLLEALAEAASIVEMAVGPAVDPAVDFAAILVAALAVDPAVHVLVPVHCCVLWYWVAVL